MAAGHDQVDNTVPNLLFSGSSLSSFACNACKKKKIKCDRVAPQCSNCVKANRSCEYPLSVPKPGPKAGFASRKRQHASADTDDDGPKSSSKPGYDTDANGNVIDDSLTEMIHPQHHESSATYWNGDSQLPGDHYGGGSTGGNGSALAQALANNMKISWADCQAWIGSYFDNMTSFSLFHRPSFEHKLAAINSPDEIEALLTAMIAFAKPFGAIGAPSALRNLPTHAIWMRAHSVARDCLEEYSDETPPLHVLQALLMTTWNQLSRGVRGRSWRTLGEVIKLCYEMRLHEEDIDQQSPRSWIAREERRRAWYLAWEMDVFASTIKRLPTSIDWCSNKTKLPVPDEDWYSGVGAASCLFALEPADRWKNLERSGNTSPHAWFVLINSYKYEAYLLSTNPLSCSLRYSQDERATPDAIRRHRDMLINCLHCTTLALPARLTLGNRYLTFRPPDLIDDAWCYMLHHMLQITKFMLYRLDVFFRAPTKRTGANASKSSSNKAQKSNPHVPSKLAWEQLIATGGETVKLLQNSATDHIKWVNPFVANAVWFGAAALVVGQVLGPSTVDRQKLKTDFDALRSTVKEFVRMHGAPDTLVSSLDTLEGNLRALTTDEKGTTAVTGACAADPVRRISSSVSVAESASVRSPLLTDADTGTEVSSMPRTMTPRSVPEQSGFGSGGSVPGFSPEEADMIYFEAPGLDLTQSFEDIDALWATTADWNFNIDCFRCPFD